MFRDGVVLVDPSGAGPLPHEQIISERADALVCAWSESAVQETPITVLVDGGLPPRLIVADGHHRCEAARRLAAARGIRVAMAARFFDSGAVIRPAHRVVRRADVGWAERYMDGLRRRLGPGSGPVEFHVGGHAERYDCSGLSAVEQMRRLSELDQEDYEWTIEDEESRALEELASGGAEAVILVPAVTLDEVLAAASSGKLLPPRSTNFQPKPPESSIRFVLTDASSNVAISS